MQRVHSQGREVGMRHKQSGLVLCRMRLASSGDMKNQVCQRALYRLLRDACPAHLSTGAFWAHLGGKLSAGRNAGAWRGEVLAQLRLCGCSAGALEVAGLQREEVGEAEGDAQAIEAQQLQGQRASQAGQARSVWPKKQSEKCCRVVQGGWGCTAAPQQEGCCQPEAQVPVCKMTATQLMTAPLV